MGKQAYIEINGKKYDVATGKPLEETSVVTQAVPEKTDKPEAAASTTVVVENKPAAEKPNVATPEKAAPHANRAVKNKPVSAKPSVAPSVLPQKNVGVIDGFAKKGVVRTPATKHVPSTNKTQKSQTLMRKSVTKPKAVAPVGSKTGSVAEITRPKIGPSPQRQEHAKSIRKSTHIQKFSTSSKPASSVIKRSVQLAPKQQIIEAVEPISIEALIEHEPAIAHFTEIQTERIHEQSRTQAHLEKALEKALAHEEKPRINVEKKRRGLITRKLGISTRAASLSSGVLAVVILAGFFAMQNVPNLAMRVAATRAGFDAEMPGYSPAGFSYRGPISYKTGQVTVSFKSNTDSRSYELKQTSSNWNSDALLANYVIEEGKQYQTFLDRGRTLYIYDGSNATWVDNGVWYQIVGDSDLTTDQLVRIASSI